MKNTFTKVYALTSKIGVLLVEDDKATRSTITKILHMLFANVYASGSIEEAYAIFTKNKKNIDLVITDIFLENASGFELIEKIKKKSKKTKFIAISGLESTENFTKAIDLDVESFILKPITTDSLLFSIQKAAKKIQTEARLAKSRKELQKAKQTAIKLLAAQDDFIKDAIHELHTPLSIIVTNADLIAMSCGELKELASIQAACKVLQTSYEDMAYMMKKDSDKYSNTPINVGCFVEERVAYFKSVADANLVDLQCEIKAKDIIFKMSDVKLQRLIDNNISNAIKYSKRLGKIKVKLYIKNHLPILEFHNFGPIISDKKKIFKRYYREANTKGGYGIGLKLVSDICREYHIGIQVLSSISNGNFFRYSFPKFENATIGRYNFTDIQIVG